MSVGPKKSRSSERDFFIHCESNGISSRVSVNIIKGGAPPLYLITPLGVYQKPFAMMIYKTKVLMICNSCGIDDIQCSALILHRFYAIIHLKVGDKMFGAIYGDIIGSYYETHCTKEYDFEFQKDSTFTDDTVLTVAVCKAILNNSESITRWSVRKRGLEYAGQFRQYYSYYPHAGFGNMFSEWARSDKYKINRSYANGAAMRAVPIGYAYDTIDQVLLQAKANCFYTHKNSEAIKAAQAVATAVFLARKGRSKQDIKDFLQDLFRYDLTKKLEDIKVDHVFDSRASYSVPSAISAFLESIDYESAIRNAISLGGDADTEACIAGGIAEAYYDEIPKHISDFCNRKIDFTLKSVVLDFQKQFCK